jgi:hypothetical protein
VNDNIISVNIPNGISILIMVAIGFVLLCAGQKLIGGTKKASVASGPNYTAAS